MSANSAGGGLYFDAGVNLELLRAEFAKGIQEAKKFTDAVQREGKKLDESYNTNTKGVKQATQGLGDMKSMLGSMVGVAGGTGVAILLANQLKTLTKEAYNFSTAFEMGMKEVQSISIAAQEDYEGLSKIIVDMSGNSMDSAIKLSKAYYEIVSSGYDGADGLELLTVSSKAATAGITDTMIAADGLTTVLNAWGESAKNSEKIADIMFKTVERGKTTFPELAQSMSQVAPIAASLKIPFEEIMGLLATLTKQGVPTAMAMTQIRSALTGISQEFGQTFFTGRTLQETFEEVAKTGNYTLDALLPKIGRIEGVSAVLAATGEKFKMAMEDLDGVTESVGSLQSAYDIMAEAADNKWLLVHNRWNRELKKFGDLLKTASIGVADFFAQMLQDREADVIAPKVSTEFKKFEAEISQIQDQEERLRLITEKRIQLKNETQKLFEEQNQLEKKQPGGFIRGVEAFNAAIGLGEWSRQGQVAQAELDIVEDQIRIRQEIDKKVEELYKKQFEPQTAETGGGTEPAIRSLKVMVAELKKLEEKLGTGTAQQDAALVKQIVRLNEEIEQYHKKVRESLTPEWAKLVESTGKIKSNTERINTEVKGQLKPMKILTDEEKKQLEIEADKADRIREQIELQEQLAKAMYSSSEILGALSYAFGEIDQDLGSAHGRMADIAQNAGNAIVSFTQKDFVSAVTSGIGVIGNIIGMFVDTKENPIETNLEKINRSLERQAAILANMQGSDNYFMIANKQLEQYNQLLDQTTKKLQVQTTIRLSQKGRDVLGGVAYDPYNPDERFINTAEHTIDQIINYWSKGYVVMSEYYEDALADVVDAQAAIKQFIEETYSTALGFNTENVGKSILSGVQGGLKLSGSELGQWSENFGNLLKQALSKNILEALNERFLVDFMEDFQQAMQDGKMTETERGSLTDLYVSAVQEAQKMWDEIAPILNDYTKGTNETALTGAIKGITQEQAGLISGQFMAMRDDLKLIQFDLSEIIHNASRSLEALERIAENTSENFRLKSIESEMKMLNIYIKQAI